MTRGVERQLEELVTKFGEKNSRKAFDPLIATCKLKGRLCVADAIEGIARRKSSGNGLTRHSAFLSTHRRTIQITKKRRTTTLCSSNSISFPIGRGLPRNVCVRDRQQHSVNVDRGLHPHGIDSQSAATRKKCRNR
jgi:hypothetical protein